MPKLPFLESSLKHADCEGRCFNGNVDEDMCEAEAEIPYRHKLRRDFLSGMLYCTLPYGHDGPHIACSREEHNIGAWMEDDCEATIIK